MHAGSDRRGRAPDGEPHPPRSRPRGPGGRRRRERRGRRVDGGRARVRRDRARRDAAGHRRLRDLPPTARRRGLGAGADAHRPRLGRRPRRRASTAAPTTTSSSRSRSPSCSRGCARLFAAGAIERPACSRSATSGSTRRRAGSGAASTEISLSAKEFALLETFMRRPGGCCSRYDLLEHAWDFAYENRSNVVDVYIRRLRGRSTSRSASSRSRPFAAPATGCAQRTRDEPARSGSGSPVPSRSR